jgi:retinol-binding protein 3
MSKIFITLLAISMSTYASVAQLSLNDKKEVISIFSTKLQTKYVFPEISAKVCSQLQKNLDSGLYDTISSKSNFAFQLTRDTREIANDLHLKITYEEKRVPKKDDTARKKYDAPGKAASSPFESILKENNYGIKSRKILTGNIGYLEIPLFGPLNSCADTIIRAMEFIANTDALILDLRSCRGALDENTVLFFLSYFFDEPMHLSDFYEHEAGTTKQQWTYAWVPGNRYLKKPVYILTSSRTFSGGEALAYDLQQVKRAVIVGETTRGGAHPTEFVRLNQSFTAGIPYARPINTISKSNWEHTGVKPDTSVKSNIALYTAQLLAAKYLISESTDVEYKNQLSKALLTIRANAPVFRIIQFQLKGYPEAKEVAVAGSFNSYSRNTFYLTRKDDVWTGEAEVEPGPLSYSFIVDGQWITDPQNPETVRVNQNINSFKQIK